MSVIFYSFVSYQRQFSYQTNKEQKFFSQFLVEPNCYFYQKSAQMRYDSTILYAKMDIFTFERNHIYHRRN